MSQLYYNNLNAWNGIYLYLQDPPYSTKYRPTKKGGEKRVNNLMKRFLLSVGVKPARANRWEKQNNAAKVQNHFTKFVEYIKAENNL